MRIRETGRCGTGPPSGFPSQGSGVMRSSGCLTGLGAENPPHNPDLGHVLKQDEKIAKYPVHPGCSVAVADAGSGNRLQGSSETISEDDIHKIRIFSRKIVLFFKSTRFLMLTPSQLTEK